MCLTSLDLLTSPSDEVILVSDEKIEKKPPINPKESKDAMRTTASYKRVVSETRNKHACTENLKTTSEENDHANRTWRKARQTSFVRRALVFVIGKK